MSARMRARRRERPEIDVTAFLNLMVVLIPFLLLSAAFSQLSIFELYLPGESESASNLEEPSEDMQLQILLLDDQVIVNDSNRGPLLAVSHLADGDIDMPAVQGKLIEIKLGNPEATQIAILSTPQMDYEQIIEVMDGVRAVVVREEGVATLRELFPNIALGPAPETGPQRALDGSS
jgi:biopolymer transport protein ExbD